MSGSRQFMRRAAPAVLVVGAAVGTVMAFDQALRSEPTAAGPAPVAASGAEPLQLPGSAASPGASPLSANSPGPSASPSTSSGPGQHGYMHQGPNCDHAREVTGQSVPTRFGPVQVSASVMGNRVCSVRAVDWPDNDRVSAQINAEAIPTLDEQATSVGADFDTISGATYTCDAYRKSLQSIIDRV